MFLLTRERYHNIDNNFKLAIVRFVFSIGTASAAMAWSLYMHHLGFSNSAVGYIMGGVVLFSFFLSFASVPLLEFLQVRRVFVLSILLYIVAYVAIALSIDKTLFIVLTYVLGAAVVFRVESFGILFRDSTSRKKLPQREGLLFAFANIGWFIAPPFAGVLLVRFGFPAVFLFAALAFFVALLMFLSNGVWRTQKIHKSIHSNVFANIAHYTRQKGLGYPYLVRFGYNAIGAFALIYLPIFLVERGVSPVYIGVALGFMSLTHAVFDYQVSRIAERRGFKLLLISGFLFTAVILTIAGFIQNGYVLLAFVPLLGIATLFIESLQDTFFFTFVHRHEDEERLYPTYNTAGQIGGFVGKALTATVLLFASERFAFLFIALLMLFVALSLTSFKEKRYREAPKKYI